MKKVLVTGTFDILHPGHVYLLRQARLQGDFLTVVVARDETVRLVKGKRPIHSHSVRAANVRRLGIADRVIIGRRGDKLRVIEIVRPDIICLGYDQRSFTRNLRVELQKRGLKTKVVRLRSYHPRRYKTSLLREQRATPLDQT
ncbi:MAG: adenylyltransferase/cytidyltransferase family protein [Patescibacteria group bacterium]